MFSSKDSKNGQVSAPFELLVAVIVMGFVILAGTYALQNLSENTCLGDKRKEMGDLVTSLRDVVLGSDLTFRNITFQSKACFNSKAESIELKNKEVTQLTQKFIEQGLTPQQAKADAEVQTFMPKPLPAINLQANTQTGKRIKLFFFITEEEYNKISEKFKIVQQFEEQRIASSCTNEFVAKLLS